ncbi:MAG: sigma-70 family RNA polymerase sigma factor [Calditrichaceae bacterium]|nr:sigma-70 family RNA polymerase sigma factor [Calditrichaceae bacterium]
MLKLNLVSDESLVERIRNNDRSALGDLFIKFEKVVFKHIQTHGGSLDDAKDMLQESIIVLWQNVSAGRFKLQSKLSTYLVAVAKNKWMVEMRKKKRFVQDDPPEIAHHSEPGILDKIVDNEMIEQVRFALDQIKPVCKQLLLLFYFEERSMEEIAKILSFANMNVAKAKKYQCKKALQDFVIQSMQKERRI